MVGGLQRCSVLVATRKIPSAIQYVTSHFSDWAIPIRWLSLRHKFKIKYKNSQAEMDYTTAGSRSRKATPCKNTASIPIRHSRLVSQRFSTKLYHNYVALNQDFVKLITILYFNNMTTFTFRSATGNESLPRRNFNFHWTVEDNAT